MPNHTLKAIRRALHMSQSEFAAAVRHAGGALGEPNECTKRLVQKWESGEHGAPRSNYKRALVSVTRTPYEQLGFAGMPDIPVQVPVVVARAGELLPTRAWMRERSTGSVTDAAGRLVLALERPGRPSSGAVGIAHTYVERLFALEQHRPSRLIAAPATRHVDEVAALLAGTGRQPLRRQLMGIGGRAAAVAGWLAFDMGDAEAAHRYWDAALAAAREASDGPLLACVLTYLSYSAAERGDPATAWQLAHTAAAYAGRDVRSRAWMVGRAAQEAAALGERSAALAELELAVSLGAELARATPGDHSEPWAWFVDAAYVQAMTASVYRRLGDSSAALAAAETALHALGEHQTKSRALVLAEVACAAAVAGQLDLVERTALDAADLAVSLEATMTCRRLRTLVALLGPYQATAAGREITQMLQAKLGE